nr:protein plastid movement impaired 1-related 1-like [Tanacetum cinerariifolium]
MRGGLQLEQLLVKQSESQQEECVVTKSNTKDEDFDDKELLLQELELALNNVVDFEKDEFDSQKDSKNVVYSKESGFGYEESENLEQKSYTELKIGHKEKGKSLKLDYATETVADDFLNMLGIEYSPFGLSSESESKSPQERLLRQFENSLANGSLFNFNIDDDDEIGFNNDFSSTSMWDSIPEEVQNKTKASVLEDMKTEALMREWGLNEKAFQRSPSCTSCGSGGPIEFSPKEPLELPPLGEGLRPFVQTSNGGFLRSMNPEIFKNAKSGGNLIMQVSSPVVVPAEMGSGIMDVLQDDDDGIMGLSVTLDEWMRLDSGEIDEGDEMSERTLKILAAHHASDLMRARIGKGSKKGGLLWNNFTVALMVQLRDPLRNFEPVGTPMLAQDQVERVFVPPKPRIYSSIYSLWNKPVEEE